MKCRMVTRESGNELRGVFAEQWRDCALEAVRRKGYCTVALSGGATPPEFYHHIARYRGLPWEATHVFQVDERLVPDGDAASNFRMIRSALLGHLAAPAASVHAVPLRLEEPAAAAREYEADLLSFFLPKEEGLPSFDIMVLGLGKDGHTASLFPGSSALEERSRIAVPVAVPGGGPARVSLTLPVLNNARNVVFLVTGAGKREILARVTGGEAPELPAARVQPRTGPVVIYADAAASPGSGT
jgi:6-phosphogluconolactonase